VGLEDGPDPPGHRAEGSIEHGGHLGRMVGIIVVEDDATDGPPVLPTPGDASIRGNPPRHLAGIATQLGEERQRPCRIQRHVPARLGETDPGRPAVSTDLEIDRSFAQAQVAESPIGTIIESVGDRTDGLSDLREPASSSDDNRPPTFLATP
jgi:hypothetical protein